MKHQKAIAEGLKINFQSNIPLTIHWVDKMLPELQEKKLYTIFQF